MNLEGKRILLADDEERLRELLRCRLEEEGMVILDAADGAEAFRHATMDSPDIIVMDLNMPGVDGFEAIRSLRITQPEIPILVLTGYASDESIESALQAGANAVMAKPANLQELVEKIRELLNTESTHGQ